MTLHVFLTHLLAFAVGFVAIGIVLAPFGLLVAATMLRQRRAPASSLSWLLAILLLPVIGIPAYWIFGNRKINRIIRAKPPVALPSTDHAAERLGDAETQQAAVHFGLDGLSAGNSLRVHATGEEAFADLMHLIDTATTSIDIETYVLKADRTGGAILELLTKRATDGVKVRLLVDGFGSFKLARRPLRRLRRAGGETKFFLPIWRITLINRSNLRNHRKIAVFDRARVFTGGRNLASEYLGEQPHPRRWADFSFVLEGPAVAHYAEIVDNDWAFAVGRRRAQAKALAAVAPQPAPLPATGQALVQVVPSGPDVHDDELFEGILALVFAARRRLWIVTPYFIPSEMLVEGLRMAAQRGVDVRIVVPERGDQRLPDLARAQVLRDLAALGAKPLVLPRMVHAKAVLVDDMAAAVGSANFDARSMFLNFEVSSVVYSAPEIAAVAAWIEQLMTETRPFAAPTNRRRDLVEAVSRLVAPLL